MDSMKRIFLSLVVGSLLAGPSFALASDAGSPPPGPPPGGPHGGLTDAERQELHKAHDAAFKANPDLAAEEKDLNAKMDAFHKKVDAAMIQADPAVAPIVTKMESAHHHHGGPDGPPPAPPAN